MLLVYFIIMTFPATPADSIDINIIGRYSIEQCEYMRSSFPIKPNRLVVCANIREL